MRNEDEARILCALYVHPSSYLRVFMCRSRGPLSPTFLSIQNFFLKDMTREAYEFLFRSEFVHARRPFENSIMSINDAPQLLQFFLDIEHFLVSFYIPHLD